MIEINNLTTSLVDEDFLRKVAKRVLMGENKNKAGLSIALVGSTRIKALNKKYRNKNKVTDVLSFPENNNDYLGEIVICLPEVKKNAKRFGANFKEELARILIHGILHLLGYDHEKKDKLMREKENKYLSLFFKEKKQKNE